MTIHSPVAQAFLAWGMASFGIWIIGLCYVAVRYAVFPLARQLWWEYRSTRADDPEATQVIEFAKHLNRHRR